MDLGEYGRALGFVLSVLTLFGFLSAVDAVMNARSPQGAAAWAVSLVTFPYLAVPLYWVFGRRRFRGYVLARRSRIRDARLRAVLDEVVLRLAPFSVAIKGDAARHRVLVELARQPFLRGNRVDLLVDGEALFEAAFAAIEEARESVLAQFFILRDDEIGRRFADLLARKARQGVPVRLLYDEIGSHGLPRSYLDGLRMAGVEVHSFHTQRGRRNRFQINFRNHRKVVVVDGRVALTGGANVGDEYLGRSPRFGPWRDTGVRVEGPAALAFQLAFVEDWFWATESIPDLPWEAHAAVGADRPVLVLPTGPADPLESCGLFFLHAIHSARKRIWITSPYFVPDAAVLSALQLAALRGVEVRILIPSKPDHLLVWWSSFSYLPETEPYGVKIHRYRPGFLHEKVLLVDDDLAAVGTANLDNRSFRLNFEITAVVLDRGFAAEVAAMLERDFSRSERETARSFVEAPFGFRLLSRSARLLAPLQ